MTSPLPATLYADATRTNTPLVNPEWIPFASAQAFSVAPEDVDFWRSFLLARVTFQPDGCWRYGTRRTGQYCSVAGNVPGRPALQRNTVTAHKLSYAIHIGPVPDGVLIRHTCDFKNCIRPDHLIPGDQRLNMRDCSERGRANPPHGERHPRAALTESQVAQIRAHKAWSVGDLAAFGREFGVSYTAIRAVRDGLTWRHVT